MSKVLLKSSIILVLIISGTLTAFMPLAQAAPDLVTVTSTNVGGKTLLQATNDPSSTSDITSITVEIKNGNFKSFTLENGWIGKKTSPTTIAFFSSTPIKPGDSTTFTISTDQPSPDLVWTASDANNNQLGTGEIGAVIQQSNNTQNQNNGGTQNQGNGGSQQSTPLSGILDTSTFRIIPSTPAPGFDVRVVGQSFRSSFPLDLYIGGQKIYSFSSDSSGNFVVTATVPTTVQPGSTDFVLKDNANNQKTFTTTIVASPQSRSTTTLSSVPLTVNTDPVLHPGDTGKISGTANPGSTLTISILNANGTSITTFTANADKTGSYSIPQVIPNDRPFGKYTVSVSDGKNQVSKDYTVTSAHQLAIYTSQSTYNPGDAVVINGTSISNVPVSIVILDQTSSQVFAKEVNVTADGKLSTVYQISPTALVGTYTITASQGSDQVSLNIGVGVAPSVLLSANLDKLNYQTTDKPILSVSAPHSSTLNLVVVDPSDQEKFSDTILVGQDGFATYSFNLTSYTPGIYSLVLTRGNDKVEKQFAVGLQTGCGQISLRTVKDTYFPGDNLLIFGNANPNCIIQVGLTDPNGLQAKVEQAFVDKQGIFSAFDFRIPDNGLPGTWKLDATSGIDHKSIPIIVRSESTLTIQVDKSPPIYGTGDLVEISGSGAGQSAGVIIDILGASNTPLQTLHIQSTNRGDYNTEWLIPKSFSTGTYTVQVTSPTGKVTTPITIQ
ncbi:MAG TPA: hypothetical protein VJ771_02870 [Candidatus Nitrosotalea sp.]|nr:hypothetical protein [Candidatus Nitrosotalea sp.]